jgi:photosystem II stability/assembly factor-like uncharacterized protein
VNSGLTVAADKPPVAITVDPTDVTKLVAGFYGLGVYGSINSGSSWTPAATQPTNLRVKALVLTPGDSTKQFAGTYGGGLFKSTDSGVAWTACAGQPDNLNIVSLTVDASGKLYAGTEGGVFVSSDACTTWTAINSGLP